MTQGEADAAHNAARYCLLASQELRYTHEEVYRTRPKWHHFDHSVEHMRLSRENPRFFHNFRGEDFIGKACKIAGACHASTVLPRTLERYGLLIAERFHARRSKSSAARFASPLAGPGTLPYI